ncbi:WD40-repeat-containing domain protein [Dimargaris cristalligena]|uniref:WD40-repeat-containing domain protein n=1 Tax=Dimargaris cristalligena TaxID=215637 RepID=A0A4P9ZYQ3_9FUNG|nr:WD40-repeat-containing domain protein [Dimargaris cristalligena]|eukprot:RKP38885.1 WD40-repeat-containing domain protein [Dimargaris cristalligena]
MDNREPSYAAPFGNDRDQVNRLLKEVKALKQKVESLEEENRVLKKSIYELSVSYSKSVWYGSPAAPSDHSPPHQPPPYELHFDTSASNSHLLNPLEWVNPPPEKRQPPLFSATNPHRGHTGAVYTAKFSNDGLWLASGSFDNSVRLWDFRTHQEQSVLLHHILNVSSLAWSADSQSLLSGSYDKTCHISSISREQSVYSMPCGGFVLDVGFHPTDPSLFFVGTSRNCLLMGDTRAKDPVLSVKHPGMVNCLHVDGSSGGSAPGTQVWTGDSTGVLQLWDLRQTKSQRVCETTLGPSAALSSICRPRRSHAAVDADYLITNAYDDTLRVYRTARPPASSTNSSSNGPTLLQQAKGFRNRNWPIGNAAIVQNRPQMAGGLFIDMDMSYDHDSERVGSTGHASGGIGGAPNGGSGVGGGSGSADSRLLLATGSAEPFAYIYTLDPESLALTAQRLEGHTERVYDVDFHPWEPFMCTSSSDFTIRLWSTRE